MLVSFQLVSSTVKFSYFQVNLLDLSRETLSGGGRSQILHSLVGLRLGTRSVIAPAMVGVREAMKKPGSYSGETLGSCGIT